MVKAVAEADDETPPANKIMKNLAKLVKDWKVCREISQH
jgi:hypothetical protein